MTSDLLQRVIENVRQKIDQSGDGYYGQILWTSSEHIGNRWEDTNRLCGTIFDGYLDGFFDVSEIMKKNPAIASKDASDEAFANMSDEKGICGII